MEWRRFRVEGPNDGLLQMKRDYREPRKTCSNEAMRMRRNLIPPRKNANHNRSPDGGRSARDRPEDVHDHDTPTYGEIPLTRHLVGGTNDL